MSTTKIGFTGTQLGMTQEQRNSVLSILREYPQSSLEVHHGQCIGADDQFHDLAGRVNAKRVLHPPLNRSKVAYQQFFDECRPAKEYLDRNHDIVDETEFLIATPKSHTEELRSGTWATIRYAARQGKKVLVVYPNGTVETRGKEDPGQTSPR